MAINYSYKITKICKWLLLTSFKILKPTKIDNLGFKIKVCKELKEGRLAILAIGVSPVFDQLRSIANSLKIPYIAIKWDDENKLTNLQKEATTLSQTQSEIYSYYTHVNQINLHPPANKLIHALIDIVHMYKWEYITVLYQETTGPERIQEFIKLPTTSYLGDKKFRLNVRQLSSDIESWIYLIKDIKLSGSSHIIVDIETKYLNKFCQIVIPFHNNQLFCLNFL